MEIYFNELSISDLSELTYDNMNNIIEAYKSLRKYNINSCRITDNDSNKLFSLLINMPNGRNVVNFYYSFFKLPFESNEVLEKSNDFFSDSWLYGTISCLGLTMAYLLDSASFSICHGEWKCEYIEIKKNSDKIKVRNVSSKDNVENHRSFFESNMSVSLEKCILEAEKKNINLRHDHGQDILHDFAKRILKCPYVCEVVNSLPYNSHQRKFIRKVKEDGLIEIVLPWTDKGLGLVVKTTGRNLLETQKIAKIIEDKYGYLE